ncbi:MAG: tail fiber domain-containing protein [Hyphomicrobiales bacterium]|nr:tail fiber domain-containing protein [Hyphomicrobiales bacterium]
MATSAPKAPAPPDPYRTAGAQAESNIQTAIANAYLSNPTTVGPLGTTQTERSGIATVTLPNGLSYAVPRFTQTTTLSPTEQALYDQQSSLRHGINRLALDQTARLPDHLSRPLDLAGLPPVDNDLDAARARIEQALFDRLNPQLERDRAALENRLVNQGLQRGTEAFGNAMDQHNRQANDQRLAIVTRGLQEQQALSDMALAQRSRALQELLASRNQPIGEVTALMNAGQASLPAMPAYRPGEVAGTDVSGNVYGAAALAQKQYEQEIAQRNALLGGLFGLGQAAILGATPGRGGGLVKTALSAAPWFSDRRLKRDVRDLGIVLRNGLKLYAFRYLWDPREHVGVMADEVARVRPDAVAALGGYLTVDYGAL